MLEHLLGICPGVVLVSSQVVQFSEEPPNLFPEWLYQLAIPPAMEECFSFSTSLPASAVTCVFDLSHYDWSELETQGCLICISLMTKGVEHFF